MISCALMEARVVLLAVVAAAFSVIFSAKPPPSHDDARLQLLSLAGAAGPESIAFGPHGEGPYTGVSDGRILKWLPERHEWIQFATTSPDMAKECIGSQDPQKEHICARPLGLHFNKKTGDLYVADAYRGLLKIDHDDKIAMPVVTQAKGRPLRFTNSLDIDEETGVVYFTDSSTRYQRRQFMSAIIAGDRTGRVMKYDPRNGEVEVLVDGLAFPNGVALSRDGKFLLIVETTTCKILKYQLKQLRKDNVEVIAKLEGFPDNIKRSPRGGYWVAMHSRRTRLVEWALSISCLRDGLLRVPFDLHGLVKIVNERKGGGALGVRIEEDGSVLEVFERVGRGKLGFISEIQERNGSMWIGSVVMPFVGFYEL